MQSVDDLHFRFASLLRLPTLGYTFVSVLRCAPVASFAPAQLALRANLRLVYLDLSQRSRFSRAFDSVKKLSELTCESQAARSLPDMLGLS